MTANLLDEPEAETDAKQVTWTLNFGPQHPATHTTLRLILELDGERIVKATPDIGYLHSGFEKLGEHLNYNQYVTIVDRKNYISPPLNEVAWHNAVEKLLGIDLTPRCKYIRVIISRTGPDQRPPALHRGRGAGPGGVHGVPLSRSTCGSRFTTSTRRCRAIASIPATPASAACSTTSTTACSSKIARFLASFPGVYADMEKLLFRNRIFLDRMRGVGRLSKEDAIALSCTGPIARASGVTYDLRKDEPYLAYPDFDFEVPYMTEGDCCARFIVRMEEMRQSHADHHAGGREPAGRAGQRADRREAPLARQGDDLQQHGRPDPALRADHAQPGLRDAASTRSTPRSRAPTASLAITSWPTAARRPGGCAPGRPRSSISRSSRTSSRTT